MPPPRSSQWRWHRRCLWACGFARKLGEAIGGALIAEAPERAGGARTHVDALCFVVEPLADFGGMRLRVAAPESFDDPTAHHRRRIARSPRTGDVSTPSPGGAATSASAAWARTNVKGSDASSLRTQETRRGATRAASPWRRRIGEASHGAECRVADARIVIRERARKRFERARKIGGQLSGARSHVAVAVAGERVQQVRLRARIAHAGELRGGTEQEVARAKIGVGFG